MSQDRHDLVCVAVVKNESPRTYWVNEAELLAGQFGLDVCPRLRTCHYEYDNYAMCDTESSRYSKPVSTFQDVQISSMCLYELSNGFSLDARSEAHIEFTKPSIEMSMFTALDLVNPRANISQMMDSMMAITSDRFLPGGELSVRQENRLVGRSHLGDLPKGELRELSFGHDSFSLIERKENILKPWLKSALYAVCLIISNNHDTSRRFRYREHFNTDKPVYRDLSNVKNIKYLNGGIEIDIEIQEKSLMEFHYNIVKTSS